MKLFKRILRLYFCVLLLVFGGGVNAFAQNFPETKLSAEEAAHVDSTITISLLTCQKGQETYSLYGHTAIRYQNREQGVDVAVNYGIFDMSQSNFVLRFIFGQTDYMMGVQDFFEFCQTYAYERRGIIEQELNLPPEEKLRIVRTIEENYKPENREYRYNIFYNNCTTKARDVLLGSMDVTFKQQFSERLSFRKMVHMCAYKDPWTQFGNDFLLGVMADKPTTISEQQFLPFNLKTYFKEAVINDSIPLVKEEKDVVPMFIEHPKFNLLYSPVFIFIYFAILIGIATYIEKDKHKNFWWLDALMMLIVGLCGLVLTAMIFSQHPTVNFNLQILVLNPLALIGVYAAFRDRKGGRPHWFWRFYQVCILLFFVAPLLVFLIDGFIPSYADGLIILALLLQFRIQIKYKTCFRKSKNKSSNE